MLQLDLEQLKYETPSGKVLFLDDIVCRLTSNCKQKENHDKFELFEFIRQSEIPKYFNSKNCAKIG